MIRKFNDPILKTVCESLTPADDLSFLRSMREACDTYKGVGLAAPQIGIAKRAVFIWPQRHSGEALFMLNPVIVGRGKMTATEDEGCLSYPGVFGPVERHLSVTVKYMTPKWKACTRQFVFYAARVVQHEIDHLDGICRVGEFWLASPGASTPGPAPTEVA